MANNVKAPVIDNPELLDRIIGNMQNGLVDNLPCLDFAFGRAERRMQILVISVFFGLTTRKT